MVYILLGEGFEEMEALAPADLLRRAGVDTALVGLTDKAVTGSHGITVTADLLLEQVEPDKLDMLVLPGGMGGVNAMLACPPALELIQTVYQSGRWLAAICAAPTVLAHLGLLEGRSAVCYPGLEPKLTGAQIADQEVVVDGHIVTARAAGCAYQFGFQLITLLAGEEKTQEVRHGIHYDNE